jgi:tellurite resistance protein
MASGGAFERSLLTAMALMTLADGRIAEDEVTRIRFIFGRVTDSDVSEDDVRAAVAEVQDAGTTVDERLASVAGELREDEKRRMLQAAFAIASADGRVVDEEDALLQRIAKALGISPKTYRAALSYMAMASFLS